MGVYTGPGLEMGNISRLQVLLAAGVGRAEILRNSIDADSL